MMTKYWMGLAGLWVGAALVAGCAAAPPDGAKVADEKKAEPSRHGSGRPEMTPERRKRMREMMSKDDGAPKVGDEAPTFELASLDGKSKMDLANYRGKKPVMLFFGSYT